MARLFFAVWPDAPAAAALAELARRLADESRGRAVPMEKIHLTLAFLGEVHDEARPGALEAAAGLGARAFDLSLDCAGSFRRAGVAWAGASATPRELIALRERLGRRLRERGFALEERPFTPHVTLARRTERGVAKASITPIAWRAREWTLVRSETATGRYVVEERWGLGD